MAYLEVQILAMEDSGHAFRGGGEGTLLESFLEEMKRYLGFSEADAELMRQLGPRMEKYFPEMAERF